MMDIQRLILFLIFSMSLLFLWEAWQKDQHGAPPAAEVRQAQQRAAPHVGRELLEAPDVPGISAAAGDAAPVVAPEPQASELEVRTDLLRARISTLGGDLVFLELSRHGSALDKSKPLALLEREGTRVYVAQAGLIGEGLPTHKAVFAAAPGPYELKPGQETLQVRLSVIAAGGVKVDKVYTFHRGSYVIDVGFEIANAGAAPLRPFAYFQFLRDGEAPLGDPKMVRTYTGPAFYTEEQKFQKVSFSDIDKGKQTFPKSVDNGWIAMLQHYFVAAWLPPEKAAREFYARRLDTNLYSAGVILPVGEVAPGQSGSIRIPLYVGPEEQDVLAKLAAGLDLTVDYGWLTVIAVPLFWVLNEIHKVVGNWGLAIILLTVMVKAIFYPLSAASYRSMAKMKAVTPRLQKIKELYGDDRQRLHQAMMDLYKTEKINPLGGCLPIVVQIPVFIALYWVLLASVELRNAPFYGWIGDLSAPDPFYVLPVVMGITMFIQTKLNPTPPDPIQARVMQIMPVAFSVFFFFFPAGLVLYWLVNNVLSIAQQWQITRAMNRAAAAHGSKR